jgi:hypothetical protein
MGFSEATHDVRKRKAWFAGALLSFLPSERIL